MRCWCGYLSAARCSLFAYGPFDATAISKPHHLLPHLNLSARRAKVSTPHVRSSCLCRGWSDDMELAFGRAARSGSRCCCFRTLTENVFVSAVFGALSALEALCDYALYKSTFYLLTYLLNTYGRRAFSVAGPMAWNSLAGFIWDPTSSTDCLRRLLKTYLFAQYQCIQRIGGS